MSAQRLTHQDDSGRPRMVDVGEKPESHRVAIAEGRITMAAATLEALRAGRTPKGDPLAVSQIAGIQAAKRTADLIPLCHSLALSSIDLAIEPDDAIPGVLATARVAFHGRTGVEMEALTAVAVALLTLYDMLKAVDRTMQIDGIRMLRKTGGRGLGWDSHAPD